MSIREILIWPDPELAKKSKTVSEFNDKLKILVENMMETMYSNNGVGLAAPQIGEKKRLFVLDLGEDKENKKVYDGPKVFINPKITPLNNQTITWDEGCLSIPGESGDVTRARHINVDFFDLTGKKHSIKASDIFAVVIQHENDHLNGKLWINYQSKIKQKLVKKKMLKLKQSATHENNIKDINNF